MTDEPKQEQLEARITALEEYLKRLVRLLAQTAPHVFTVAEIAQLRDFFDKD